MYNHTIKEMLAILKPVLKNQKKAQALLEKYWSDKIAIVWDTADIHRAANELETVLTEDEAVKVLNTVYEGHSAMLGLKWENLTVKIRDSGLGRDITKRELHQFVRKDVLTIQKKKK